MADPARARRLAVRIRQIVSATIEMQIKDPRLGMVTITDARGREVLRAAVGPYLLVDLPAGSYTATARYQEQSITRKFSVGARKGTRVAFDWRR